MEHESPSQALVPVRYSYPLAQPRLPLTPAARQVAFGAAALLAGGLIRALAGRRRTPDVRIQITSVHIEIFSDRL